MPAADRPRQLDLVRATALLERGMWAALTESAMAPLAHESEMHARLVVIQIHLVRSMYLQVLGDVVAARGSLDHAAFGLPAVHRRRVRGRCLAVVAHRRPSRVRVIDVLIWRTARVIAREQAGLAEHEHCLRPGMQEQKELFTLAYIEHLRRVDCDYHLLSAPASLLRGVAFDATAKPLARRATNLCRLADPLAPDVAEAAFRGAGGAAGIRASAFRLIAGRPVVPSRGPGTVPAGAPLRDAHLEAYRRACLQRDGDV